MSLLKSQSDKCKIECRFEGGTLDGKVRWTDEAFKKVGITKLAEPKSDECLYQLNEVYKLISGPEARPLIYKISN